MPIPSHPIPSHPIPSHPIPSHLIPCAHSRGFAEIFIAIGVVSLLGMMSLSMQMTASMNSKKVIARLDNLEGFYSSELAVWHAYERIKAGFTPNEVNATSLGLAELSDASADAIEDYSDGKPVGVGTTSQFAPSKHLYRRLASEGLTWNQKTSAICATSLLTNKKKRRVCLSVSPSPPSEEYDLLIYWTKSINEVQIHALKPSGEVDTSFGNNGSIAWNQSGVCVGRIAFYPDGRFLADKIPDPINRFLSRYLKSGILDTTFGSHGNLNLINASLGMRSPVIIDPSGAITYLASYRSSEYSNRIGINQIFPNGSLNPSFGNNGVAELGNWEGAANIQLERDGQGHFIVMGDYTNMNNTVIGRFTSHGILDTSFGVEGVYRIPDNYNSDKFLLNSENSITMLERGGSPKLVRILPDGTLHSSYAIQTSALGQHFFTPNHLVLVKSPKSGRAEIQLYQLSDGKLVQDFGDGGTLIREWAENNHANIMHGYYFPPDSLLLGVLNYGYNLPTILRLEKIDFKGNPDPTFGTNGIVELQGDFNQFFGLFYPAFR